MKKFLTFAAVLMLAACSSDEIFVDEAPHASSKGQVPIAVNTYLQGQTKAILTADAAKLQENGFMLLASYTTGGQPTVLINQQVEYSGNTKDWILYNANDRDGFFYWPRKQNNVLPSVQFGAVIYNPVLRTETNFGIGDYPVLNQTGVISVPFQNEDLIQEEVRDNDNSAYPDIIAAHTEATSETNNGVVNLDFNHILAQVCIAATYPDASSKVYQRQWSYIINSIKLEGSVKGNYNVLTGTWETGTELQTYSHDFRMTSYNHSIMFSDAGKTISLSSTDRTNAPDDKTNDILAIPGDYKLSVNFTICENADSNEYSSPTKNYTVSTPDDAPVTLVAGKRNIINIKLPDTDKMDMGISVGLSDWVDGGNQEPVF